RDRPQERNEQDQTLRRDVEALLQRNNRDVALNDSNQTVLSIVTTYFPMRPSDLPLALTFMATMWATANAMNSLSSTTVVDIYKRFLHKKGSDQNYLNASRLFTLLWGIITLFVALFASKLGNLLEAVNILGSLFYGTILGIFLVAFYFRKIGGKPVFWSAILSEVVVFTVWKADIMAYLWLNLLGCCCVIAFSYVLQLLSGRSKVTSV